MNQRRAIQKIALLPSIPVVLQKIIETSGDPNASAHDLQETLMKDQSICAAILKLANSAYYGYAREVDDIERAVVIIGFNTSVSVAISVSVLKSLSGKSEAKEFNKEEFWKHTIAVGETARIFARLINYEFVSRAYITGLVHDIGKVVLSFLNSTDFDDAVFECRAVEKPLYDCEKDFFGFDHQDAGKWLGERWHLPESIIAGIKYHHHLEGCPDEFLNEALIVHAANRLVKSVKFGNSGNEVLSEIHPLVEEKLGITSEILETAKEKLKKAEEHIENFLQSI